MRGEALPLRLLLLQDPDEFQCLFDLGHFALHIHFGVAEAVFHELVFTGGGGGREKWREGERVGGD